MRIEERRDLSLTMERNNRRAKMEVRSYTKQSKGVTTSLTDNLNDKLTSGENSTANAVTTMLKKTNYNNVKNTSKELQEKAKDLLEHKEDREAAVQGVYQFAEVYNNLLSQMSRVESDNMDLYSKELKEYTAEYKEAFQKMGIDQGTDGTLQVDPLKIQDADLDAWYEFLEKASKVAAKVQADAESNLLDLNKNQTIYGIKYNQYGQEE